MLNNRPVALAFVTQTQMDMLGGSLKIVFKVEDGEEQFAQLLRALDSPEFAARLMRQTDIEI